jgi:hypothetical protein
MSQNEDDSERPKIHGGMGSLMLHAIVAAEAVLPRESHVLIPIPTMRPGGLVFVCLIAAGWQRADEGATRLIGPLTGVLVIPGDGRPWFIEPWTGPPLISVAAESVTRAVAVHEFHSQVIFIAEQLGAGRAIERRSLVWFWLRYILGPGFWPALAVVAPDFLAAIEPDAEMDRAA